MRLSITPLLSTLFVTGLLLAPITSFADDTVVYMCKQGNEMIMTNIKSALPENCADAGYQVIPEYKTPDPNTTGLREGEKQMLEVMQAESAARLSAEQQRYQNVDERVGAGIYGRWQDSRHDQCVFYKTRIEENSADRKNDVRLNREIERDLRQLPYYCN